MQRQLAAATLQSVRQAESEAAEGTDRAETRSFPLNGGGEGHVVQGKGSVVNNAQIGDGADARVAVAAMQPTDRG